MRRVKATVDMLQLELSSVGYALATAVGTEEALAKHVVNCTDDFDSKLSAANNELRWVRPAEGWYPWADKDSRQSNKLLDIAEWTELYPQYEATLEKLHWK